MRKHTAEQVNEFLQAYHFDNEANPRQKGTHFDIMKHGILSVCTTLFLFKRHRRRQRPERTLLDGETIN